MAEVQRTDEQGEPIEEWRAVLADFVAALRAKYGDNLDRVLLFGSRARGDYDEDSDVDVIVVLKHIGDRRARELEIWNLADEMTFFAGHDVLISPMVWEVGELKGVGDPLRLNVEREAVAV